MKTIPCKYPPSHFRILFLSLFIFEKKKAQRKKKKKKKTSLYCHLSFGKSVCAEIASLNKSFKDMTGSGFHMGCSNLLVKVLTLWDVDNIYSGIGNHIP